MAQGWRNNPNQGFGWKQEAESSNRQIPYQQQPHYPSLHERTSKLEDTFEKFMQASLSNQKNTEASIRNLETQKSRDPGSFTLPVTIGNLTVEKALLDLGASINLMPLSMLKKIGDVEVKPTRMTLQLVDRSIKYPHGIVEDLLVKVDKFLFPVYFVVMDIEENVKVPLILGRPFMKTAKVIIDVDKGRLKVCAQYEEVSFNAFEAMKYSNDQKECFRVDVIAAESLMTLTRRQAI
ncbi:uncharacterized protein [Phaseolus vulgaris]|uniref:uncharacterized protein n=1 Tax=Phaseolus vulgaris TaxID=3885 RepID=UPI0035CA0A1E